MAEGNVQRVGMSIHERLTTLTSPNLSPESTSIPGDLEDPHRQEIVSEPPVKTFRIVILTRAPRLDVQRANAHKFEPAALSDKLGFFVATDVLRHTPHRGRFGEPVEHKAPAPSVIRCLGSPQYQP